MAKKKNESGKVFGLCNPGMCCLLSFLAGVLFTALFLICELVTGIRHSYEVFTIAYFGMIILAFIYVSKWGEC